MFSNDNQPSLLVSLPEACRLLGGHPGEDGRYVSPCERTVRRLAARGALKLTRLGTIPMITRASLMAYVEALPTAGKSPRGKAAA